MIKTFFRIQSNLTGGQLIAITLLALLFNFWATAILNAAYTASEFPVPYWQAQLSFDDEMLKGWYGSLLSKHKLGLYVRTQIVDFVFIVSVLILHTSALLALSRGMPATSKARQLLVWAALLSTIAPLSDAVENCISFIMLANPTDFEPSLALAYSSVAAIKFGMFTFAYVAAIVGLFAMLYFRVTRARHGTSGV